MGMYQNIVNGGRGYMLAGNNISPADRVEEQGWGDIPPLRKWSDFAAIHWQMVTQNPQPLRLVIRSGITNQNTIAIIKNAFRENGRTSVPDYPGQDFVPDGGSAEQDQAFRALLGTYHGAGVAYMLAQHRAAFGRRTVTRIRAWSIKGAQVNMGMILFLSSW